MRILFITGRIPFPPDKGDKSLAFNRLRLLSLKHQIRVLVLHTAFRTPTIAPELRAICESIEVIARTPLRSMADFILAFLRRPGAPFQALLFTSRALTRTISRIQREWRPDVVDTFMIRIADNVAREGKARMVLDMIDCMQANFSRRLKYERSPIIRIALRAEIARLRKYEPQVVERFDAAVLVSSLDAQCFSSPRIRVLPLGVVLPKQERKRTGSHIVAFSGNMGYFPNEDAVIWFASACFGEIRKRVPDARFLIIGTSPGKKVLALSGKAAIVVTGRVPSLLSVLSQADVAVAPLRAGSGMQFKILESMSLGIPVVCTQHALGSIAAVPGIDLCVAATAEEIVDACVSLLEDAKRAEVIGHNGRLLVEHHYTWEGHSEKVEKLYASSWP